MIISSFFIQISAANQIFSLRQLSVMNAHYVLWLKTCLIKSKYWRNRWEFLNYRLRKTKLSWSLLKTTVKRCSQCFLIYKLFRKILWRDLRRSNKLMLWYIWSCLLRNRNVLSFSHSTCFYMQRIKLYENSSMIFSHLNSVFWKLFSIWNNNNVSADWKL